VYSSTSGVTRTPEVAWHAVAAATGAQRPAAATAAIANIGT
jgi:hypothetical protein